ncbi:hypothetical protein DSUL_100052 [Desulfovibrionales bacterium]
MSLVSVFCNYLMAIYGVAREVKVSVIVKLPARTLVLVYDIAGDNVRFKEVFQILINIL